MDWEREWGKGKVKKRDKEKEKKIEGGRGKEEYRKRKNKEIAEELDINEKTVSTYKTRLLKKLKVDNLADLIHQSRLLHIN